MLSKNTWKRKKPWNKHRAIKYRSQHTISPLTMLKRLQIKLTFYPIQHYFPQFERRLNKSRFRLAVWKFCSTPLLLHTCQPMFCNGRSYCKPQILTQTQLPGLPWSVDNRVQWSPHGTKRVNKTWTLSTYIAWITFWLEKIPIAGPGIEPGVYWSISTDVIIEPKGRKSYPLIKPL